MTARTLAAYDPWAHLAARWPEIDVIIEPMPDRVLGQLRYPVIALRDGTSSAQRRSTLAHELVHLERGVFECGPWQTREETLVEAVAARRLVSSAQLGRALRELGSTPTPAALAALLDVDTQTVRARLANLSAVDEAVLTGHSADELWGSA